MKNLYFIILFCSLFEYGQSWYDSECKAETSRMFQISKILCINSITLYIYVLLNVSLYIN